MIFDCIYFFLWIVFYFIRKANDFSVSNRDVLIKYRENTKKLPVMSQRCTQQKNASSHLWEWIMLFWVLIWSFFWRSLPSIPLSPTKLSMALVYAWKFRGTFLAKIRLWIWHLRRQSSSEIYLHMINFPSSLRICSLRHHAILCPVS